MHRLWLACGALAGLGAVALSAYAAHGARLDPGRMAVLQNGITMQGWHALALLATALLAERRGGWPVQVAGTGFTLGLLLFCGAVYAGSLGGLAAGGVAPVGGVLLMLGWAGLFVAALRR